ncbi:hypothetical protein [Streptomyces sp. NPDC002666]
MRDYEIEAPAHPTEEEDHGMRITSAYEQLFSRLSGGEEDFWDRPDGSWGEGEHERAEELSDAEAERRADANSAYVIGSKALRRDELGNARAWFAVATDAEHPGAAFRSALTAARSAAHEDISACHNLLLLHTALGRREAEVRRWLRVAADWGHGDARHLIGALAEDGEDAADATGLSAGGGRCDGEASAFGRPMRVEDTEFYDELHTFLLVPGHGERPEPGQEPEAEPALSAKAGRPEDAGESSDVLVGPAGGVPGRPTAPLLSAHQIRRVPPEHRLLFVLLAACGENLPAASSSRTRWSPDGLMPPGEQVREHLALPGWSVARQHVARSWTARWGGLRTDLPPAVVTSLATSLQMAEVELLAGDVVGEVRLVLDRVMSLTAADRADAARRRNAGAPEADHLRGSILRAASEQRGAAARAPLAWLLLKGDVSVVEAAGADRLPSAIAGPSSLRACRQDSASLDASDRFGYADLWREWAQWLVSASSGVASRLRHAAEAEAGQAAVHLWCTAACPACEPDWWVVLAHVGWPGLDTAVNAPRDADHGSARATGCRCGRCARARPNGRLPQARSQPNTL